jgi:hypothetical protein
VKPVFKLPFHHSTDRAELTAAESTLKSLNASILDYINPKLEELSRSNEERTLQNEEALKRNK